MEAIYWLSASWPLGVESAQKKMLIHHSLVARTISIFFQCDQSVVTNNLKNCQFGAPIDSILQAERKCDTLPTLYMT